MVERGRSRRGCDDRGGARAIPPDRHDDVRDDRGYDADRLALDAGAAQRQALGIVVIGGFISSLLLTLVLVPVMFMWLGPKPRSEAAAAAASRRTGVLRSGA